jgi:hypothetical protein
MDVEIANTLLDHDVFSKEAVIPAESLVEVTDFSRDLNSFAGRFVVLTLVFYVIMALYYYSLDWTWSNAVYVCSACLAVQCCLVHPQSVISICVFLVVFGYYLHDVWLWRQAAAS